MTIPLFMSLLLSPENPDFTVIQADIFSQLMLLSFEKRNTLEQYLFDSKFKNNGEGSDKYVKENREDVDSQDNHTDSCELRLVKKLLT